MLFNGNLYKLGLDDILRRCALEHERQDIIQEAHFGATGGQFSVDTIIKKSSKQVCGSPQSTNQQRTAKTRFPNVMLVKD